MGLFNDPLLAAKGCYVVFNIGYATVLNYFPAFYQGIGFDKAQIGVLMTLPCLCAVVGAPLWGAIADKMQKQRAVHIFCIVTGACLFYLQRYVRNFYLMCFVSFLGNCQIQATVPLLDQAVLMLLDRVGGEYGKQRLWGAVGYAIGAYTTGKTSAIWGQESMFVNHVIFMLGGLLVLRFMPEGQKEDDDEALDLSEGMRLMAKKKDLMMLLIVCFLLGIMFGTMNSFLTLFLFNLSGGVPIIMGMAIMIENLSELPAFFYAKTLTDKVGVVTVMIMAILGYGMRITAYSYVQNAWYILPFELGHAAFGLAWSACTSYIYEAAPPGTEGTMLGVLSMVQNGLGSGAATFAGGFVYEHYGGRAMWKAVDCIVPVAVGATLVFAYLKRQAENDPYDERHTKMESAFSFTGSVVPPMTPANYGQERNFLPSRKTISRLTMEAEKAKNYGTNA